jgi:hypothetical protein
MISDDFRNNGFFTGVVEDIDDPEQLGRIKVRVFGFHSESKMDLPTEDLPWSHPVLPITSASISSIGRSATGLLKGSWVVGMWRDGVNAQDGIIIGSIPSISTAVDYSKGFADPDEKYPKKALLDEPDNPIPARDKDDAYKDSIVYKTKDQSRQEEVETASVADLSIGTVAGGAGEPWSNLVTDDIIAPKYPKNHVTETESGHVLEQDDTDGKSRISEFHKSGTYQEVVDDGSKTIFVVGDEYEVCFKDKKMLIRGDLNVTVEGDQRTLVKGNRVIEIEGDDSLYVKGSRGIKVGGNDLLEVDQCKVSNIADDLSTTVGNNETKVITADQDITIMGSKNEQVTKDNDKVVLGNDAKVVTGTTVFGVAKNFTLSSNSLLQMDSAEQMKLESAAEIQIKATNDLEIKSDANVLIN